MKKIILLTSAALSLTINFSPAMATCTQMCGKYCCDKLTQDTESPNIYYDSLENATYTISQNTETNETTVTVDATDLSNISSYTKKEYTYKSGKLISEASTPMRYLNYGGMYTGWVSWGNAGTTTYDYLTVGDDEYKLNNTPVNDNSGHYLIPEYTYMQNIDGTYTRSALVAGASSSFSYNIIDEISVSDGKAIIEHHTFRNFCNPMEPGCKHSYSTETYDKDGNLLESVNKGSDNVKKSSTSWAYDDYGNVISETAKDAQGNITSALAYESMNYDSVGHLLGYIKESTVYNSDGTYETTGTQYSDCKGAAGGCTTTDLGKKTYSNSGNLLKVGNKAVTSDCAEADINANCTQCAGQYVLSDGLCFAPWEKKRYTPAEAAQYLKDTDNEIIMTFKVNR